MKLLPEILAAREEIQSIRRTIHAHPEIRYEEVRTSELVAQRLEQWGEGYDLAAGPPMPDIAGKLSQSQIDALASYLSFIK